MLDQIIKKNKIPCMREDIRVTISADADDHARNLSRWHQEYDQFSPGVFNGKIAELWLPDLQLFIESTSQTLHQTCVAWPGALWFGIPVSKKNNAMVGAAEIIYDSVAIRPGGSEFKLWTPNDYDILGIVVREETFIRYASEVEHLDGYSLLKQFKVASVDPEVKQDTCSRLIQIINRTDLPRPGNNRIEAHKILQDQVLGLLVSLLITSRAPNTRVSTTYLNRRQIVEKIRDYVIKHPEENVSVPDLCRMLHISRRSLQYSFEEVVQMSPIKYLRAIRLNEVRRRLFFGGRYGQVTEVAMSWGFTHLGQFSRDYQKLFGVLPSETVRGEFCDAIPSSVYIAKTR